MNRIAKRLQENLMKKGINPGKPTLQKRLSKAPLALSEAQNTLFSAFKSIGNTKPVFSNPKYEHNVFGRRPNIQGKDMMDKMNQKYGQFATSFIIRYVHIRLWISDCEAHSFSAGASMSGSFFWWLIAILLGMSYLCIIESRYL